MLKILLVALLFGSPAAAATFTFKARNCERPDTKDIVVNELTASMVPISCMPLRLITPDAPVKASKIDIVKRGAEGCRLEKLTAVSGAGRTFAWTSRRALDSDASFYVDCLLSRFVRNFPAAKAPAKAKSDLSDEL